MGNNGHVLAEHSGLKATRPGSQLVPKHFPPNAEFVSLSCHLYMFSLQRKQSLESKREKIEKRKKENVHVI